MEKISLLIVEDHAMTRTGLRVELSQEADIDVVDVAGTAAEAIEKCNRLHPQVVLLDLHLPDSNGPKSLISTFVPLAKVVVFSAEGSNAVIRKIMELGAAGFVSKADSTQDLLVAIRRAGAGQQAASSEPVSAPVPGAGAQVAPAPTEAQPAFEDPNIGSIIDERYRIVSCLGMGSYSVVYQAMDLHEKKLVAIKLMHPHIALVPNSMERLRREVAICQTLRHPNVATTYGSGITDTGQPYLAMEFLSGLSLDRKLRDNGPMSSERVIDIVRQICAGLHAAHSTGIVHRDIKPANIHIANGGLVKLLDFGLVKAVSSNDGSGISALTATGETLGTPCYMSPEQCYAKELDGRSDLYSLGCLMYEMLTGELLFNSTNTMDVLLAQINTKPNLKALNEKNVPKDLIAVIDKLLQKDPRKRFESARELNFKLGQINVDESGKFSLFRNWP